MADRILVSTEEMNATVVRYQQAQETMMDAQKSMHEAMDSLDACWKGPAWVAMMAKWAQIEGNILKSQEALNRSIVGLRNVVSYYETGEDTNKSTAGGLETGAAATVYVE